MAYFPRYIAAGEILTHVEVFPLDVGTMTTKREVNRRRDTRRRSQTIGQRYVLADIAKRDKYRCHICRTPVDMRLSGRHPQGPTADHLIPVSRGGGDDAFNIALAHSRCNIKRSTNGVAQLRLVG